MEFLHSQIECRIFPPIFDPFYRFYTEFWNLFACREAAGKFCILKKNTLPPHEKKKNEETPEDILREIYRKIYEENRVFSIISLINLTIIIILTIKI